MRILIFHGYLLRGTGSNVYNASLVRALVDMGHEVHLLCQDRDAGELPFVDAVGRFDGAGLSVEASREPVRCTAYLPDIGRTLPVYVADRYEGFEAVPFAELDDEALDRYLDANVEAARRVAREAAPDVALANHLIAGPAVLARAIGGRVPYAVKVHGSALEYVVRPHRRRFLALAREGLAPAGGVLVGSRHTAESLWEVMDDPALPERTRLGPPGVDVRSFRPREPGEAAGRLHALAERLSGSAPAGWGGEAEAPDALRAMDPRRDRIVAFVGKLIVSKGVDLLLAAWPLVVAGQPDARLCVVGFGTYRDALLELSAALGRGDLEAARAIAARGRELEGGPPGELRHLAAFLDGLGGDRRGRYLEAAPGAFDRVSFTGRLEHDDLPDLLPACEAQVVPSTFPEAFGMVAVEAAACGALPVSAGHSGLLEVSRTLAPAVGEDISPLLSFPVGDSAIEEIASRLVRWLAMPPAERAAARRALSDAARGRYGWERVAEGVIAAAESRLDELPRPGGQATASG
ncbi:MAG: glycosyltransferase family 4 protein [Actinobacteria bacterium]|nr:glycosyltransferase family 4 protein [Actinomycetota bacterium]